MRAFLTLSHGNDTLGRLELELYDSTVPKTVRNFVTLLQKSQPHGYQGSTIHRLIPGFMAQGGDFTNHDGTGGHSIYGKTFDDENFVHAHVRAGTLSMANAGPNTNGSQFFITFRPTKHLDQKHVVFGHVDLTTSADTLAALEEIPTLSNDKPKRPVTIVECGIVQESEDNQTQAATMKTVQEDEDEIDIEGEDPAAESAQQGDDAKESSDEDDQEPKSKSQALKDRLRKLKKKMNQARQLNRQAVKEEGEQLSLEPGAAKYRQKIKDRKAETAKWEARHGKALEEAEKYGVDPKELTQQAADSLSQAHNRALKAERAMFSPRDYHNPEGQYRNYERSLKSIRHTGEQRSTASTYNPLDHEADPKQELEGARRLANEMHRRIERQKKASMKRKKDEDGDVSHINKRNKGFNEKINRTYDKHTAEIRQNLERGTAL